MAGQGHNVSKDQLLSIIERIENMQDEKSQLAADIREVLIEAKSNGFDTKAIRAIVRLRAQDAEKRKTEEAVLETYLMALGMI